MEHPVYLTVFRIIKLRLWERLSNERFLGWRKNDFMGLTTAFEKTYFRIHVYLHVLIFVLYMYYMSKRFLFLYKIYYV